MTNESKAEYEARAYRRRLEYETTLCNDDLNAASVEMYNRCLEMAKWKDQQFKEYLEKLIKESTGEEAGYFVIRRIINEFFKEENK